VDRIAALFDTHLELVSDVRLTSDILKVVELIPSAQIRDLYRDRAALEREYASKLLLLARKAADKKSKLESLIVFGGDPAKAWDGDTLRKKSSHPLHCSLSANLLTQFRVVH